MKLSELSAREYIAIEFLPGIMQDRRAFAGTFDENSETNSKYALRMADAFLRVAGRERELHAHEIAELCKRLEKAEMSVEILRALNEKGPAIVANALHRVWELLGVSNQTAAMLKLKVWENALSNAKVEIK